MSAPAANALPPAPRTTTQRTVSSACSVLTMSRSLCHIGSESALRRSGLFSVTVATSPSRAMRTVSKLPVDPVDRAEADPRYICYEQRHEREDQRERPADAEHLPERQPRDRRCCEEHGRHRWRLLPDAEIDRDNDAEVHRVDADLPHERQHDGHD